MAKLNIYQTFEEKQKNFNTSPGFITGQVQILFDKLTDLHSSNNFIFRGMNCASKKLYNSAQREFLRRELYGIVGFPDPLSRYSGWINQLIKTIKEWNNNSVGQFFKSIGLPEDDIGYLSFMQHMGIPSPLVDFTHNPFVALFFATDNVNYNDSDNNLNSSIAIYWFNKKQLFNEILNVDRVRNKQENSNVPTYDGSYNSFISHHAIAVIENSSKKFRVVNNMNVVNQDGCFIFNWQPVLPLEEAYIKFTSEISEGSIFKELNVTVETEKIHCLNIHKSNVPLIREELKKRGITNKYIFPEITKYATDLVDKSIADLIIEK